MWPGNSLSSPLTFWPLVFLLLWKIKNHIGQCLKRWRCALSEPLSTNYATDVKLRHELICKKHHFLHDLDINWSPIPITIGVLCPSCNYIVSGGACVWGLKTEIQPLSSCPVDVGISIKNPSDEVCDFLLMAYVEDCLMSSNLRPSA